MENMEWYSEVSAHHHRLFSGFSNSSYLARVCFPKPFQHRYSKCLNSREVSSAIIVKIKLSLHHTDTTKGDLRGTVLSNVKIYLTHEIYDVHLLFIMNILVFIFLHEINQLLLFKPL